MSKLKLRQPSPAMVVALVALLAGLGGSAYAGSKIGSSQIKKNAITTNKIKNNAVTSSKIKKKAVTSNKIKKSAVTTNKIPDITITSEKIFAPTLWAYVDGSNPPSILRGYGAVSVSRAGPGNYRVEFVPNDPSLDGIDFCSYSATAAEVSSNRNAQADLDPTNNSRVLVRTRNPSTGTNTDTDFNVAVYC